MPDPRPDDYPSLGRAWTMAVILFLAGVVSAVDRGVLNMVVDPVRHALMISDVQIGLLQGLTFGLFYATIGVPLGLVVDRANRKLLLAAAVFIWSLATIAGGLAPTFGAMALSRVVMGIAEATLGPCALSLISDMFPLHRRGAPLSVHMLGSAIASGVGAMLVGFILTQAALGSFAAVPALAGLAPWRLAFILVGTTGLIVVLLLLSQREPPRRGVRIEGAGRFDVGATARYFAQNWRVFLPFYGAFAVMSIGSWACMSWTPTLLMRHFHLAPKGVGQLLGATSIFVGAAGALIGGQLVDRLAHRWGRLGKLKFLAFTPWLALPASMAVFAPSPVVAVGLLALVTGVMPMSTTAVLTALSEMAPSNMRGVSVTLLGVASSFIGLTVGPLLVGAATEHVFHDPAKVGYSLLIVAAPALVLASAVYLLAVNGLKRSLDGGSTLAAVMAAKDH
jgi:MFS family permease